MSDKERVFTKKQQQAIQTKNKDILVSAGAGSGKTTVLTSRLIERIKEKDSVNEFLVVTFMKAAAADVKSKLYDALLKESVRDKTHADRLYRQSLLVSEADICTISAYCLSLVKENFALLGISPKVKVMDETEAAMYLKTVVDSLISDGYNSEDESFLRFADNFTGDKNDTPLSEAMTKLYNSLRVTLDRSVVLHKCADSLREEARIMRENGFFATETGGQIQARLKTFYKEFIDDATDIYDFASTVAEEDSYLVPLQSLIDGFESIYNSLDADYVNYCQTAENAFKNLRLASKGCDKESREIVGEMKKKLMDEHAKIKKRYIRGDDEYNADSFDKCAELVLYIDSFMDGIERGYEQIKRENCVLDYSDFEKKALELLETTDSDGNRVPTELCLKKQSGFKEILIDEYQDVNPMQDRIFTLLSGKSHRFMVGDVKQSIYRFRNAYPDIFLGYKEEYADIDDSNNSNNACIFLRENFRCGEAIINYVNYLFKEITEDTPYYREYDGEWLVFAADRIDRKTPVVVAVADKEKGRAIDARRSEAEYIASEICRLINEETADDGSKLRFSDFAVMLGAMKGYSIEYEKAFNKYGIPYKTEVAENFLENPDIRLAVSALKAIDDPTDDIALCSLMRSPICNFDSNDLYVIRKRAKDVSFYDAVLKTAAPNAKRKEGIVYRFTRKRGEKCVTIRCRAFLKRLASWRESSNGVPCREFLKSFFVSSGLLRIASASGNKESLLLLYEYATKYDTISHYGISGFLDYLKELSSGEKQLSDTASGGDEDAVSFITVHKSKGLEFKVCFLAGCEKQFRGLKSSSEITFLRGEGLFFRLKDRVRFTSFDPLCDINAVDKERENAIGEELRKLYVALTRAKERLYITGSAEIGWQEKRYTRSAKSWLDMVLYAAVGREEQSFFSLRSITESNKRSGYRLEKRKRVIEPTESMLSTVNFVYPYRDSVNTVSKISVSELREGILEDDEYNKNLVVPLSRVAMRPKFVSGAVSAATDIGTANHLFMQFCDFNNIEKNGIVAESERLLEIKMLSAEQKKMLDIKALEQFFGSELYDQMKQSKHLYREKRFSVSDKTDIGDSFLVQGVIDCFYENSDGSYTVVDYKTDRVRTDAELVDRHRVQLSYYKRAVESMTGKSVTKLLLYSFALDRAIEVE